MRLPKNCMFQRQANPVKPMTSGVNYQCMHRKARETMGGRGGTTYMFLLWLPEQAIAVKSCSVKLFIAFSSIISSEHYKAAVVD